MISTQHLDPNKKYLFRYFDNQMNWEYKTEIQINREAYEILSETKCGYWILLSGFYWPRHEIPRKYKKFVLDIPPRNSFSKNPPRRYAYLDSKAAYTSFIIRKNAQAKHLERGLERCKRVLEMIKNKDKSCEFLTGVDFYSD